MAEVRHTAALVAPLSRAAVTAPSFSAPIVTGRPPRRLAGGRGKPGLHALLDQRPFELGERAERKLRFVPRRRTC